MGCPDRHFKITNYNYGELEAATNCAAHHYASLIPPRDAGDSTSKLTVALLASSGHDCKSSHIATLDRPSFGLFRRPRRLLGFLVLRRSLLTYSLCSTIDLITELALSRLGLAVLMVSINNPPPAIAHLLKATNSTHLLVGPAYEQVGAETLALGQNEGVKLVQLADPSVHSAKAQLSVRPYTPPLSAAEESKQIAFIVHSSGSTGFPKPIYITHAATIYNIATNFGLRGLTTLPLYHNHGHSCMYRALFSLKPLYLFPSSELPLTTGNVLGIFDQPGVKEQVQAIFGVPYLYKLLAEEENGIDFLKTMELCLYGGSAMPTELGHRLVEAGVKLVGHYVSFGAYCWVRRSN